MKSIVVAFLGILAPIQLCQAMPWPGLGLQASTFAAGPGKQSSKAEFLAKIETQALADILATLLAAEGCEEIQLDDQLSFSRSSRTYDRSSGVRLVQRCAADAEIGKRWFDIRIEHTYDHYDEATGTASPVSTKVDVEWAPLDESESFDAAFRELLSTFTDGGDIWLDPETSLCTTLGAEHRSGILVEASSCGDSAGVMVKVDTTASEEGVAEAIKLLRRATEPSTGNNAVRRNPALLGSEPGVSVATPS